MKRLLSFLLCIVFLQAQTAGLYAKRGGPDIGNTGPTDLVGTYAGVLTPIKGNKATNTIDGDVINALGIFSLSSPRVGPSIGVFLLFAEGVIFDGSITAVGDPGKGKITGMVDASYQVIAALLDDEGNQVLGPTNQPVTQTLSKQMVGTIKCKVVNDNVISTFNPLALLYSQRLEGKAEMGAIVVGLDGTLSLDTVDIYEVDGVRQTTEVAEPNFGEDTGVIILL